MADTYMFVIDGEVHYYSKSITEIFITSLHTGGTEAETQVVIDRLQAQGWNVMWGTGPSRYCDAAEEGAFQADFIAAVEECVNSD